MRKYLAINSDFRCTYEEDDRIEIPDRYYEPESVIYRAVVLEPGSFGNRNLVAVKKFRIDSSTIEEAQVTNPDLLVRWKNITKLKHENVVSYHKTVIRWMPPESAISPSFIELNFVMDYCDGSDLQTMIDGMIDAKRPLHVKTLFDFSKQMANGLAYLHENHFVHGDLKPNSVLVNQSYMNHFRLRLCGLDSCSSSYAAFAQRRCYGELSVAPEVLTIIRDGASLVLDDPIFSALHKVQKLLATGNASFGGVGPVPRDAVLMQQIIHVYGSLPINPPGTGIHSHESFLGYLQGMVDRTSSLEKSHPAKNQLELLHLLQKICSMDPARAQQLCAALENDKDYSDAQRKAVEAPVVDFRTMMSVFFQHILGHTTASLETSSPPGLELLSTPNQNVRIDGRKADIFSIGTILHDLAQLTFDRIQKLHWLSGDPTDLLKLNNDLRITPQRFLGDEMNFYLRNFVPRDFRKIVVSCQQWSADERLTAEELTNKLVTLEELTYGSTWDHPTDGVNVGEESGSHRQMLEEIGCTCAYHYCFREGFLGQGAYGYVYEAKVTNAGTYKGNDTVAVKQVTLNNITIQQMKQDRSWGRAKEQWQKLVELQHPHLVTYHKVTLWKLTQGAAIEFMMDYCKGGDLDALITQCKTGICSLSAEDVANYATQLARGLCYLHDNHFVHGDLKPGNVFMDRATDDTGHRTLRIGDLDSALRISDSCNKADRSELAGTGPYMSPEMLKQLYKKEHEDVGFPTDIWSFGCVVLDLANCSAGIKERLFYKTITNVEGLKETHKIERGSFSPDAFLFQVFQGYHPFVSELIPQDLKHMIERCLIPACKDRATCALIMEHLHN